jgi:hypothetical protein
VQATSAAFTAAASQSHTAIFRGTVLREGQPYGDPVEFLGGSVVQDATAQSRGRLTATLSADALPLLASDPVTPFGNELLVERGIRLPTGDEYVSLIVAFLERVRAVDSPSGLTVSVSGRDRTARVARARFMAPYVIAAGANGCDAIRAMVDDGVPGLEWIITPTTFTFPALAWPVLGDRLDAAHKMAAAFGYELFADGPGRMVLRPVPVPTGAPVFEVAEGPGGVLVSASKEWSNEGAFNAVVATGEASGGATYIGTAIDNDPGSPSYFYGTFGAAPRGYSSPFITSDAMAIAAAEGILANEVGTTEAVDADAVPNPAIELADIFVLRRARLLGSDQTHIVQRATYPIDVNGRLSLGTRSRRLIA